MNYASVKYCDIANGKGCRTVLFVSGCRNRCKGCFQPETWDFSYGTLFDQKVQAQILESLQPAYIRGITLLGGEPFEEENQKELLPFLRRIKQRFPKKDVWAYTGYVYDRDLIPGGKKYIEETDEFLSMVDVLVDGPFIEEEKDISLKFRGSFNQRLIDLRKSRQQGCVVLLPES